MILYASYLDMGCQVTLTTGTPTGELKGVVVLAAFQKRPPAKTMVNIDDY